MYAAASWRRLMIMVVLPGDVADQLAAANEDVQAPGVGGRAAAQPLGLEVVHVDLPCAEEEVLGVDAAPLVAAMADHAAGGDRPVHGGPRQAMGEPQSLAPVHYAVAVRHGRGLPQPAARQRVAAAEMGDPLGDRPVRTAARGHQVPPPRPSSGRIATSPTISSPR